MLAQGSYDLVLTDTKMPGLDGIEFFHEAVRRFPALKVVFLTGDLLAGDKREALESTGAPVLAKPFDVADVRRLVHDIRRPAG